MKKIFTLFLTGIIGVSFAQTQLHNAKVTGIITMGNKEVAAIQDLETECIFKSEAHPKGLFQQNDEVQLELTTEEQGKILKPSLPEVVYAHRHNCKNENNGREFTEAEVRDNMTAISVGLTELSTNQAFVDLVYTEVAKEFDGDYNVLLKTLHTETAKNLNFSLEAELRKLAKKNGYTLENGFIHGFNINGNKFYPQVFVPDYSNITEFDKPIVSVPYLDGDADVLDGFKLQNSVLTSVVVNEDIVVKRKEAIGFVVSINETVDHKGNVGVQYLPPPPPCDNDEECEYLDGERIGDCDDCDGHQFYVNDCECWRDKGENYDESPNDCLPDNLVYLENDGRFESGETPCNSPGDYAIHIANTPDPIVCDSRINQCSETITSIYIRDGDLRQYESWLAGAPEIFGFIKSENSVEENTGLLHPKRKEIEGVRYMINKEVFQWQRAIQGDYYGVVWIEKDATGVNTTVTVAGSVTSPSGVSTASVNITTTFNFDGEDIMDESVVGYCDGWDTDVSIPQYNPLIPGQVLNTIDVRFSEYGSDQFNFRVDCE